MTYEEVIKRMTNQVKQNVKHYKSDFEIDKEIIGRKEAREYVWIIRDSGTHIASLGADEEENKHHLEYIKAVESCWSKYKKYLITFNADHTTGTMKLLANYM